MEIKTARRPSSCQQGMTGLITVGCGPFNKRDNLCIIKNTPTHINSFQHQSRLKYKTVNHPSQFYQIYGPFTSSLALGDSSGFMFKLSANASLISTLDP